MSVTLSPMPESRMPDWLRRSADEYARDLIAIGRPEADAHRAAAESMARSFPDGQPAIGHAVFDVLEDGRAAGYLWIGPSGADDPGAWWVWDIVIDEDCRGRGLGRAAMLLGEEFALANGAHTLGLSVFAFNTGARRLYESLGFETITLKMSKPLGARTT